MSQMNERKNNVQTRRMTSIARKMQRLFIRRKIGQYIASDIFLFVMLLFGWLCMKEFQTLGEIDFFSRRQILHGKALPELTYRVLDEAGNVLLELKPYAVLQFLGGVILAVAVLQLFNLCFSYRSDQRKIRRILAPINEIALKADELSKMTFTEEKYHQIEDAISNLEPEDARLLSFGDADLQGIEAAMNNLLVRMRDSYRQQARFVDDASHELRTPIAVIQGYAGMLSRWGREDEKVLDESIAAIQQESDHMKHLVEQLLFLARGDSGRTKLTMEPLSLNALIREVYEESLMIDEKHPYRCQTAPEDITVSADTALLKQAVRILTDNAAKYTAIGDEIILSAGLDRDGCPYLQVQDTGIGMAQTDVEHMFERFYRADEARSYQGTGLGLSIAKWIVDKHRGHFEILSRTELGTRVRIVLPGAIAK